jgi:uridine kinase
MIPQKPLSSVLIIGVAGGSGSGKTTFSRLLQTELSDSFCSWLAQDRYYRSQPPERRGKINYDHPESLEFELLETHLLALRRGEDIQVPKYDFAAHDRLESTTPFACRPVIIVDGILLLSQPQIRRHLDFSFFIETNEVLRFERRLLRDVKERGRTPDGVREQFFATVKPMHDQFVEPSSRFASRIISGEASFGPVIRDIVYGLSDPALLEPSGL